MKKLNFVNRVLLIMNEMGNGDTAIIFSPGADNTQVDRYIEGSFVDAWRRCAAVLDKSWLGKSSFDKYPIVMDLADGTGSVVLPNDFYLLDRFKMLGWKKPVFDAYVENDRVSSVQSNKNTRGSQIRPVCTLGSRMVSSKIPVFTKIVIGGTAPITLAVGDVVYLARTKKIYTIPVAGRLMPFLGTVEEGAGADQTIQIGDVLDADFDADLIQYTEAGTAQAKLSTATILTGVSVSVGDYYKNGSVYYIGTSSGLSLTAEVDGISQVLNYFSLQEGLASHTIEEAIYIPSVKPLSEYGVDEELGLDPRIIEPLAYLSASTVFTLFGKNDISKALEEKVVQMFPGFRNVKGNIVTTVQ